MTNDTLAATAADYIRAEAGRQEAHRNTWKALARRLYRQRQDYLVTIEQLQAGWDEALAEVGRLRRERDETRAALAELARAADPHQNMSDIPVWDALARANRVLGNE